MLWALGGWEWKYWRKTGVPLVLAILAWPLIKWWVLLQAGLIYGSLTLPYGDEKTDLPRWLCGLAYAIPLVFIAYFSHKWLWWVVQVLGSSIWCAWVNNHLNAKLSTKHKDRITEALTAFGAYCLMPFML